MSSHFVPRLASSTKWTDLPAEFTSKVQSIFSDQFKIESNHGDFLVEGRIYPEEIIVRLGYLEKGRLKQINFEASMDIPKKDEPLDESADDSGSDSYSASLSDASLEAAAEAAMSSPSRRDKKSSTMELIYTGIDALGSIMEEYFETDDEDELDVPTRWKEFDFEGSRVYLQYSTANTRLEEEADRLLGVYKDDLVVEQIYNEDALFAAEVDTELALEVQKVIREGKHPLQAKIEEPAPEEQH